MFLRLATRGSTLAWTQAGDVAAALTALGHEVEMVRVTTQGDVTTRSLATLGGVGVFAAAVREAVLAGDADLAVHSFKDLPTDAAPGLTVAAVPERADPADVICTRGGRSLDALPPGAKIGTGSRRRAAQVLALRPDIEICDIRGNVETRLARLGKDLDAVLLAAAGLARLGRSTAVAERFDPAEFLPAPAQGALAVECREDADPAVARALARLDHRPSRLAALAERAVLARLGAGCAAPVGAYATTSATELTLRALVAAPDGTRRLLAQGVADLDVAAAEALGWQLADELLAQGAAAVAGIESRAES